jgi:uncharacterized protein YndB with AHSA1/START domain
MNAAAQSRAIIVEEVLPHSAEKVWRMLTQAESLAQWLMPNDFKPAVGHKFTFRTKPMGDWDGVVRCEVLEIRPLQLLRYSPGRRAHGRLNSPPHTHNLRAFPRSAARTATQNTAQSSSRP